MSDTDDTDALLLIPPDLFIFPSSPSSSEGSSPLHQRWSRRSEQLFVSGMSAAVHELRLRLGHLEGASSQSQLTSYQDLTPTNPGQINSNLGSLSCSELTGNTNSDTCTMATHNTPSKELKFESRRTFTGNPVNLNRQSFSDFPRALMSKSPHVQISEEDSFMLTEIDDFLDKLSKEMMETKWNQNHDSKNSTHVADYLSQFIYLPENSSEEKLAQNVTDHSLESRTLSYMPATNQGPKNLPSYLNQDQQLDITSSQVSTQTSKHFCSGVTGTSESNGNCYKGQTESNEDCHKGPYESNGNNHKSPSESHGNCYKSQTESNEDCYKGPSESNGNNHKSSPEGHGNCCKGQTESNEDCHKGPSESNGICYKGTSRNGFYDGTSESNENYKKGPSKINGNLYVGTSESNGNCYKDKGRCYKGSSEINGNSYKDTTESNGNCYKGTSESDGNSFKGTSKSNENWYKGTYETNGSYLKGPSESDVSRYKAPSESKENWYKSTSETNGSCYKGPSKSNGNPPNNQEQPSKIPQEESYNFINPVALPVGNNVPSSVITGSTSPCKASVSQAGVASSRSDPVLKWRAKPASNAEEMSLIEKEKLRRQHCEGVISELQGALLERCQQLAVSESTAGALRQACSRLRLGAQHQHQHHTQLLQAQQHLAQQNQLLLQKIENHEGEVLKMAELVNEAQQKSKLLSLQHQEKVSALEGEVARLRESLQDKEERLQEARGAHGLAMQLNQQATDSITTLHKQYQATCRNLSQAESKVTELTTGNNHLRDEVSILKAEKSDLRDKVAEEKSRNSHLDAQKKKLQAALNEAHERIDSDEADLKSYKKQVEDQRNELKVFYQQQVEGIVREKVQEFQRQLDLALRETEEQMREREAQLEQQHGKQLHHIHNKQLLEINVIEEKHKEEVKLYRLQLAHLGKIIQQLEDKVSSYRSRRGQLVTQLHSVMEAQWQQAVRILTHDTHSGNALLDADKDRDRDADKHRVQQPEREREHSHRQLAAQQSKAEDKLKDWIKLLLQKCPGVEDRESVTRDRLCSTDFQLAPTHDVHCETTSDKRTSPMKPPWK